MASAAIPEVFRPVKIGNEHFVDGGVKNLIPTPMFSEIEEFEHIFILLCNDDKAVVPDNSIAFYRALNRRGVKAEMHIYPEGGHGFWMRERYKYGDETYPAVIRWIERHRTNN